MGSCFSSSHTKKSSSAFKFAAAFISKPDDTTSPLNNHLITYAATISDNPPIHSAPQDSAGSKEEILFFDSRGWLDSDCDDDFMSVDDGEFTPSRGTTPVHHKFGDQTSQQGEENNHQEEPSTTTDNKKRLVELFKETQDEDEYEVEHVHAEGKARSCLWLRTPVRSSAPATPCNNNKERQQQQQLKRVRSAAHGGCVPRLVSCSSFTERRRKMMSHAPH